MQLLISGYHVDTGVHFQNHVDDSFKDFNEKHNIQPLEASVKLSKEQHQFKTDISCHTERGVTMRTHGLSDDAMGSFDAALNNLTLRLRRHKKRIAAHHKSSGAPKGIEAPYFVLGVDEPSDNENTSEPQDLAPPVIAELKADIPNLTVGEAIMRLDLSDQPAMMFYNHAHGGLNMVYRRSDGNIGWVDPNVIK